MRCDIFEAVKFTRLKSEQKVRFEKVSKTLETSFKVLRLFSTGTFHIIIE